MKRVIALLCVITLMVPLLGGVAAAGSPPHVNSQAAVVIDYDTGAILYEKSAHTLRSPASMSKVMTAFIVYEQIAAGRLSPGTSIPISAHARALSNNGVLAGSQFAMAPGNHTVETLLQLIMLPSSNAACIAMAEYISGSESAFVALMNSTAHSYGLNANFVNPHGASRSSYNHITAHSMAMLVRTFIQRHPDILRIASMSSMSYNGGTQNQTNLLIRSGAYQYGGADGFKTGTTAEAGACLSSTAFWNGKRIIVVTMNASNSDNQRYHDSRALLNYGFAVAGSSSSGNWVLQGSTWYYKLANGANATGWIQDGATWYYLQPSGAMATGWIQDGATWYYLQPGGAMATGWIQDGETWYYLQQSGAMATGWIQDGVTWYYLQPSGAMATGIIAIDGVSHTLQSSGAWVG